MNVSWTRNAEIDLDHIEAHIGQENPIAACDVIDALVAGVALLTEHPHKGRPGRVHGTREWVTPYLPYIVVYAVMEGVLVVYRVLHSARKWPRMF